MDKLKRLEKYIDTLQSQSFAGWTDDEKKGYLTALISVRAKIKKLKNT